MKTHHFFHRAAPALLLCSGISLANEGPSFSGKSEARYQPGEILVKLRPSARGKSAKAATTAASGLIAGATHKASITEDGWQLLGLPDGLSVGEAITRAKGKAEVEFAEPNLRYDLLATPDDPMLPKLYGMEKIGAAQAWAHTQGSASVVIAVFDTGVDYTHPELAANMWQNPGEVPGNDIDDDANGYVDDVHGVSVLQTITGNPIDSHGHGTHVAGTIGAVGNNGSGVTGVNWNVKILAVRVARDHDGAFTGDIVRGLDYLTALKNRGINLVAVNHSWGGPFPSQALADAFARLSATGVVNVCAAMNGRMDHALAPTFPNEYNLPGMISVAASNRDDHLASFTDFGIRTVDLAAPGVLIWSTFPGNRYMGTSGTSMAAPHVTGAVGLLHAIRPGLTAEQARNLLMATVDPLPAFDRDRVLSGGRLNAGRAVQWLVDGNPLPGAFVRAGLPALRTNLISQAPGGFQANGLSQTPGVSDDGRFVCFLSQATNLVAGDTNAITDVLLRDRQSGTTVRVSQTADGTGASNNCSAPTISGDGSVVVFTTPAPNLVAGDSGSTVDVILWERATGILERVSLPAAGQAAGTTNDSPSVSRNGRRVAFRSLSPLVPEDTNGQADIYLRDRDTGVLQLVSVTPSGGPSSGAALTPAISADGRHVAFASNASDLVAGDGNGFSDVFVRNLETGVTARVSMNSAGVAANGASAVPRLSGDGRFLAFQSVATNLDPTASVAGTNFFLHDREAQTTVLVNRNPAGQRLTGITALEGLSADGRWVLLRSNSTQLPPFPAQAATRLFAYDRLANDIVALAYNDAGETAIRPPNFMGLAGDLVQGGALSSDGRHVVYASAAWNLSPGDGNVLSDVFHLDRGAASLDLSLSVAGSTSESGRGLVGPAIDQTLNHSRTDGADTVFNLRVTNRGDGPVAPVIDMEVTAAGAHAAWPDGTTTETGNRWRLPVLAPGASVVFPATLPSPVGDSMARIRLAAGTAESGGTLAVTDRITVMVTTAMEAPGIEWVSRTMDRKALARHAESPTVSADGSKVVFGAIVDTVVASDVNESMDVFLRDRSTGLTRVVNSPGSTPTANEWSTAPQITQDGRFVLFHSWANNLGPDANYIQDVFLKNLGTGALELLNRRGNVYGNFNSQNSSISHDGRYVAYQSHATNLVTGDTNLESDVFYLDRQTGTTLLISRTPAGQPANGDSEAVSISADGRFVVFNSRADNLTADTDTNRSMDAFLWDSTTGTVELLSRGASGTAAGGSASRSVSADGRFVFLSSDAPDLAGGLTDGLFHDYLLDRVTGQFKPIENHLPAASPPWHLNYTLVSSDGAWLTLTMFRSVGAGDLERVQTRVDLVHRTTGERRVMGQGDRGPGAPADGFSVVAAAHAAGSRFQLFQAEGREGRPFISQAYLYDRASPGVNALAGRSADTLRNVDSQSPQEVLRELTLLVTPGQPREFRLALHNSGDVADTLRLAIARLDAGWTMELRPSATPAAPALVMPASFPTVPVAGEVLLTGLVTLPSAGPPGVVEFLLTSASNARVSERIRITILLDTDGDLLADVWETTHFAGLLTANGQSDTDLDGVSDVDEFIMDTNPKAATPPLEVTRIGMLPDGRLRLEWPAMPTRLYTVESSDSLPAPFLRLTEPAPGSAAGLEWLSGPATSSRAFYRVRAHLP